LARPNRRRFSTGRRTPPASSRTAWNLFQMRRNVEDTSVYSGASNTILQDVSVTREMFDWS